MFFRGVVFMRSYLIIFVGYLIHLSALANEVTSSYQQELSVQFMVNQLKTNEVDQTQRDSYNRLSINLDAKYLDLALFKIEIEQFQNQFARSLEVNQFFVQSLSLAEYQGWIWGFGYMPIPVSKLNVLDDQLFLTSPLLQKHLFTFDRQMIESGGYLGYQKNKLLLRIGAYQRLRQTSLQEGPQYASLAPYFVQIKKFTDFGELGLTYFSEQDAGSWQKNNFGFNWYSRFNNVGFDFEGWSQDKLFKSAIIEQSLGGYLYLSYFFLNDILEVGVRYDFLNRPLLKDAWGQLINNLNDNNSMVVRWMVSPQIFFQFENLYERHQINNKSEIGLSGYLVQLSYSAKF